MLPQDVQIGSYRYSSYSCSSRGNWLQLYRALDGASGSTLTGGGLPMLAVASVGLLTVDKP